MIVSRIYGGLGNQLFQYAAGYALARKRGCLHRLDLSWFSEEPDRDFLLDRLLAECVEASEDEISRLRVRRRSGFERWIRKLLRKNTDPTCIAATYVKEAHPFTFDQRLLRKRGSLYLDGYWQSYRYIEPCEREFRNMISPQDALPKAATDLLEDIRSCTSVAVHVRRGDYVTSSVYRERFGLCPPSYYREAMSRLRELGDVVFFLFSDDPDWVRDAMDGKPDTRLVSGRYPPEVDFWLMANCRHFIIANSSFSWWAAWLGKDPDKQVIAPAEWLADGSSTPDLIPSHWVRIGRRP